MMKVSLEQLLTDTVRGRLWLFLAVAAALSLLVQDLLFSLGVLAGGLLATGNFLLLHRSLKRVFAPGRKPTVMGVVGRSYLRFFATGVVILILLKYHLVGAVGLLIGLSVVVLNLALTGICVARRAHFKEA